MAEQPATTTNRRPRRPANSYYCGVQQTLQPEVPTIKETELKTKAEQQ
jgi:hypothetical protein